MSPAFRSRTSVRRRRAARHVGTAADLFARVERLDTSIFAQIETQTTEPDRRSLLALHAAMAQRGPFNYLEIGSHLGGSLQALIADPRCVSIVSIDTRPSSQPDDRGGLCQYPGNTTERMVVLLHELSHADLAKLTTIDRGTDELTPADLPVRPELCFIDGEHTHAAVLRDARFSLAAMGNEGVIAFHDANVVGPAIDEFLYGLVGRPHTTFLMPDSVYVVELGPTELKRSPFVQQALLPVAR